SGGVTTSYAYNGANQLCATSTSGTASCSSPNHTYDANGNQTSAPGLFMAYNALNQLCATSTSGTPSCSTPAYTYADVDQTERVSAAGTNFASDILGLSATSASTYYTRDNDAGLVGQRVSGANQYFLLDGLGSVVKLIDSTGAVVRSYTYDAWGKTTVGSGTADTARRYAGGYSDTTGLNKFGTRYYDSKPGRWTQQDPLAGSVFEPSTLNRYVYVGDDPVNFVDPTGSISFSLSSALGLGATELGIVAIGCGFVTLACGTALGVAAAGLGLASFFTS
ncbi:MAG: RHS repeat-associated core domain-containing protein, partial [Actinomycetota bacterium]|nr:RHS repeat-associated core domain-containing protein [Actinomycetota bacterium]